MDPLDRIESKLDKLTDTVSEQASTLAANTATLEEHVRRTNLLEATVQPIQKHVAMVEGALKAAGVVAALFGALGAAAAVVEGVLHVLAHLKGAP